MNPILSQEFLVLVLVKIQLAGFVRTVFAGGDLGELAGEGRRMVEKEQIKCFLENIKERTCSLLPTYVKSFLEMTPKGCATDNLGFPFFNKV